MVFTSRRFRPLLACCIPGVMLCGAAGEALARAAAKSEVPDVLLSKGHESLCRVRIGDTMPDIELPTLQRGEPAKLADLAGAKATLVVFWSADRRMARELLADLPRDVVEPFADQGLGVVGVAVGQSPETAAAALQEANAQFPNLLDREGEAFAKVGSQKLPRIYLLDGDGKVLWFDIEYSLATRRELQKALHAVLGNRPSSGP